VKHELLSLQEYPSSPLVTFPSGVPEFTPGDFPFRSTWVHPWWLSLQEYLSSPVVTFPSGVPEFTPGDFPFRSTWVHPWWLSLQYYLSSPLVTFPSGVPEFTPGDFPFRSTRVHPWWLSLQEYLSSPLVFGGVHVVQCFVFFVVFCSYIFIVLAHWNNISQVDLLLYSTHFPRLVDIQSLLVFLNVLRDGK
jgi:hypothetical protein